MRLKGMWLKEGVDVDFAGGAKILAARAWTSLEEIHQGVGANATALSQKGLRYQP